MKERKPTTANNSDGKHSVAGRAFILPKKLKIRVKVKTRAKEDRVDRLAEGQYKVWVKAAPEKGRANEAVIEALSKHLGVPRSRILVVAGKTSTQKTVQIN